MEERKCHIYYVYDPLFLIDPVKGDLINTLHNHEKFNQILPADPDLIFML